MKELAKTVTVKGVTCRLPQVGGELLSEGQLKIGSFAGIFKSRNPKNAYKITLNILREAIRKFARCVQLELPRALRNNSWSRFDTHHYILTEFG